MKTSFQYPSSRVVLPDVLVQNWRNRDANDVGFNTPVVG